MTQHREEGGLISGAGSEASEGLHFVSISSGVHEVGKMIKKKGAFWSAASDFAEGELRILLRFFFEEVGKSFGRAAFFVLTFSDDELVQGDHEAPVVQLLHVVEDDI